MPLSFRLNLVLSNYRLACESHFVLFAFGEECAGTRLNCREGGGKNRLKAAALRKSFKLHITTFLKNATKHLILNIVKK